MGKFSQFLEAKQVGDIYHFTRLDSLHNMMNQESPFHLKSHNEETISATRNPILPVLNKDFRDHEVRITIDGDKLSNHHKISPLAGLVDNEKDVLNHKHNLGYRVSRHSNEAEEAILKHPLDLRPYIKHIHIVSSRNHESHYRNRISPKLDELNIPHSYIRSWSRDTVRESVISDWSLCYIIG